jgi:hypothetical protein
VSTSAGQEEDAAGSLSLTSLKIVLFNHEFHIQTPVEFTLNAANSCHVAEKLCRECLSHTITKSVLSSLKIHKVSTKWVVVSIIWLFQVLVCTLINYLVPVIVIRL